MSVLYHSFDSSNLPVNELVAGAYAEHTGSLGGDENLSTTSRNWVENRAITQRILQDESDYLTKVDAAVAYVSKSYIESLYPIGTIYINDTATSVPFDFGTWNIVDSKFLYGCASDFSDLGDTGGATTVTLAKANLPTDLISISIPALSGSTSTNSVDHTHSFTTNSQSASGYTNYEHYHTGSTNGGEGSHTHSGYAGTSEGNRGGSYSTVPVGTTTITGGAHTHSFTTSVANTNHAHTGTTDGMSANSTHSHTVTTNASSTTISLGSGTAFNILPPYKKVGIWRRSA